MECRRGRYRGASVKIGLVCPYIYPDSGGVAQHVRFLYENLRLPATTSGSSPRSHGPQRSSEGDIIRIGVGFSCPPTGPSGRSRSRLATWARSAGCWRASGSTCSTSTSRSCHSCRSSCCASRRSVNVATFHAYAGFSPSYELGSRVMRGHAARLHGRIAVSAAARHFIDRFFPGDYKVIPNGVDVPRYASAVPLARWQDGTRTSCSSAGTSRARACSHLLKAQRILRKTGYGTRLLVVGSGPQEREARRYVATRGLQGVEFLGRVSATPRRPSCSGRRTCSPRRRPAASRSGSSCSRRWPPGRRSSPPTSTATRASSGAAARACWSRRTSPSELAQAIARLLGRRRPSRRDGRRRPRAGRGIQLAAGDRQGRGLLRLRHPPARRERLAARRLPGAVPQAPPLRARPSASSGRPRAGPAAADSASASLQTQAE